MEKLRALAETEGWKKIAAHQGELAGAAARATGLPVLLTDGGPDKNELAACDAGISECDALIAQTGSILVTAVSAGGRALSVLPPHHVVLARRDPITTTVRDVMTREVVCIGVESMVEDAMALMTHRRCRHLPAVADGAIVGLVSIGDLARAVSHQQVDDIQLLHEYIGGASPA